MSGFRDSIKKAYEESRRFIMKAKKENQLVLFVGTGTSKDSGMPLWSEAVRIIADRLGIDKDENIDTIRIPQYYYNARGKKEYTQLMREIFRAGDDLEVKPVHKELIKLSTKTIVTTNYDNLLEKAAEENAEVLDVVSCNEDLPYRKGGKELVKIHGDFEHDNFVLKEDDYLSYSRHFGLVENYIKSLIGTKVVLFVGYSFSDPDVKQVFDWVKDIIKGDFQRAYLIEIGSEYNKNEEAYYKNFGVNILYASIALGDWSSLSYTDRLMKMLSWLQEEEEKTSIDQIYYSLRPLSSLKYAYWKYVAKAFRKAGLQCENGIISCMFGTSPKQSMDTLKAIAYEAAKRNEQSCYVFADKGPRKRFVTFPDKYESKETEKIKMIVDVLEKSALDRIELSVPNDAEFPAIEDEQLVFDNRRIIVSIKHEDTPDWIKAIRAFDYKQLQIIEEHNDERLGDDSIDLYMEQAYISYFRKRYLKTYNLLKIYSKLQYKKKNYAEYFLAETCRKYVGKYIAEYGGFFGINIMDRESVEAEIKSIDLDRTFFSLPDMGDENRVFKDFYTFEMAYTHFQEAYKQSQKVQEQAKTEYSSFLGNPAFNGLRWTVYDFYKFEINNAVVLDEYEENREIFRLYFTNMIMSVTAPDKGSFKGYETDSDVEFGNVHADTLMCSDIYFALRYMSVSELRNALKNIDKNLEFDEETKQQIVLIIQNSEYEPGKYRRDRLIWKLITLLSYSHLSEEMVSTALKVLNSCTNGVEHGDNRDAINRFLVNAERQKLINGTNVKMVEEFVDSEVKFLVENHEQISLHETLLINGTYFCNKYGQAYDKISYFKKLYKRETEFVCLKCYLYLGTKIRKYIRDHYKEWTCNQNYSDFRKYVILVSSKIIKPDPNVESAFFKYVTDNARVKEKSLITHFSEGEELCSCMLELFLQKKIVKIDDFLTFINKNGNEFHRWLVNPTGYDYHNFKSIWLNKCNRSLLLKLSSDKKICRLISQRLVSEYNKNGLDERSIKTYFTYFTDKEDASERIKGRRE